ncbi:MAG TPA: ATP-binding protein [Kofleriaceae bacterium]|nr:ATP-binding protein [Kofleriaceae bacterium]
MKPANVVGPTVRGPDFWGREAEVQDLWRLLAHGSVLLTAPRRHGKSSLMNALADDPQAGWTVLYLDVEYVETPSDFVTEVTAALLQLDAFRKLLRAAAGAPGALLRWVGKFVGEVNSAKEGLGEIKISLRDSLRDNTSWAELAEQLLKDLERFEGKLLLIIDEFPMMVANFLDRDETRAIDFLKWFRAQRQQPRKGHVRFLLGGSVNIEPRLERLRREALLNDLERFRLEPLTLRRAAEFVTEVLEAENANFESGVPEEIVRVANCGIHFFLQVLISECLTDARQHRRQLAASHVEPTYRDRVLGPSNRVRFSHYRSRLKEYYGPHERAAHLILDELATKERATTADLLGVLARADEPADIDHVLALLESDHYIASDGEEVKFSSGFLRDWWLRNAYRSRGRG